MASADQRQTEHITLAELTVTQSSLHNAPDPVALANLGS